MRYSLGVACGVGAGLLFGWAIGVMTSDEKYRKEYQEASASMRRAMELAREAPEVVEAPAPAETALVVVDYDETEGVHVHNTYDPTAQADFKPEEDNPYHTAVAASDTPHQMFVDGGINDYGCSYIEEEEYEDDTDGRFKGQITILMDEHNPIFLQDGGQINDWDKKVGDSILVDFYKHVPPGVKPVLYVRNHNTGEDWEVIRDIP